LLYANHIRIVTKIMLIFAQSSQHDINSHSNNKLR